MELKKISSLDEKQVLNYLGCGGKTPEQTKRFEPLIKSCSEKIISLSVCRAAVTEVIPIEKTNDGIRLLGTDVIFRGSDIEKHLINCTGVILFCATIGAAPLAEIRRTEAMGDTVTAFTLDCCASAAAEAAADMAEQEIKSNGGMYYTCRYSPGYGNFDIGIQSDFLRLLDAQRKIGVTLTKGGMLAPSKSITAAIGVSNVPVTGHLAGCDTCKIKDICEKRKRGEICGI